MSPKCPMPDSFAMKVTRVLRIVGSILSGLATVLFAIFAA